MSLIKIRKYCTFFFVRLIIEVSSLIAKNISKRCLYAIARFMGYLLGVVFLKHRRIAYQGLQNAFGKAKSSRERRRIVWGCFVLMAKSASELLYLIHRPNFIRSTVRIKNQKFLDQVLNAGKGVVLVSAHFGNFPLMLAKLSLEGYKTAVIMRPLKEGRVEEIFEAERLRIGIKTILSIPRRACVEEAIRSLRDNYALLIPLDQNFGTAGVFVDFFGAKAATATGPVILAQRTGAAILPCFIVRQKDDSHEVIFEPPLNLEKGKDEQETVTKNIQKVTTIIEFYIRKYPSQWSWIHRRWKAQPKGKSV